MKLHSKDASAPLSRSDFLVAFAFQGDAPALPRGVKLPREVASALKGEFREVRATDAASGPCARVAVVGLGKKGDADAERLRRASALGAQRAEGLGLRGVQIYCPASISLACGGARAAGGAIAEGARLALYRFQRHKSKPKAVSVERIVALGAGRDFADGFERGGILAEACAFARDLQNEPANRMRPRDLAAQAKKLAQRSPRISCKVLGAAAMERMGMGALLSVAQGSDEPPQLVHLVYRPRGRARGRVALVGKGLTFDSGGISIKPAAKMWEMKYDMSGGAAVLGVFHALASIDLPFEVHGVVPCSENLLDARATKPGDLVRAMNGTTIEVLNTDAEGRLILCDALAYVVKRIEPDAIVDLATLTGAVVVALGHEYTGIFTSSAKLRDALVAAGDEVGERVWPLPLADHHREQLKGEVGDLKNIALGDPGAGASVGAAFLSHFTGDVEWAHLDIAGTAWGSMNRDWVGGPMGSGVGVRLLVRWLESRR